MFKGVEHGRRPPDLWVGASHNQADANFFRGFPPFSFYRIEFYLQQTLKFAVLRSLNLPCFNGFLAFSDYKYSGS
jgi:hypothetical protein